jgi:hypothetical protein
MGAVHRTNSTSVMNGVVEIIVARIVRYARFQPLKCGWESPKNLGATASMKFHGVSPEPIFETSYPSCGLQRATGLQGGRGPLEVRCRQEIPFDPKGVERAKGGSLLRCIRRVTRLQLQSDAPPEAVSSAIPSLARRKRAELTVASESATAIAAVALLISRCFGRCLKKILASK